MDVDSQFLSPLQVFLHPDLVLSGFVVVDEERFDVTLFKPLPELLRLASVLPLLLRLPFQLALEDHGLALLEGVDVAGMVLLDLLLDLFELVLDEHGDQPVEEDAGDEHDEDHR